MAGRDAGIEPAVFNFESVVIFRLGQNPIRLRLLQQYLPKGSVLPLARPHRCIFDRQKKPAEVALITIVDHISVYLWWCIYPRYACGFTGVRPWRRMISIIFAGFGGPPAAALITSAASRKYSGPIAAGEITQSALTSRLPKLSNR